MKPIYFPFTYVSDRVAEAVAACFGHFIVYRPLRDKLPEQMQSRVDRGVLDLRVPVTENEKALKTAVKNYLDWANLHMPGSVNKTADLKSRMGALPYFDDSSTSRILADVKEKIQGNSAGTNMDSTLAARIFLCLAQEFDRQNQEVADEIYRYHQQEADLIRQLKMEEDPLANEIQEKPLPNLFADYMVSDRLGAWARILRRDPNASALFVTHSPAVMVHLLDRSPTTARVARLESIPRDSGKAAGSASHQQKLLFNLKRLAQAEQPTATADLYDGIDFPAAETTISLNIYLVPNQTPAEFFARCAQLKPNDSEKPVQTTKFKNTLIAFIECLGNFPTL